MKKLLTIFGAFFFASAVLTSCGSTNLENLDKDIDSEEDAVEALMIITEAQMEMLNKAMGPYQELADMKDRGEDIQDAINDVEDKIRDEEWSDKDLRDADNWDDYEDLQDELEDLQDDLWDLEEDIPNLDFYYDTEAATEEYYDDYDY